MSQPYARTKVGTVGSTAASVDLSGKAKEITLSSTTDCWINFNGVAIANECFYLPADKPITIDIDNKEQISVIRDTADGYLSVLESANVMLITIVKDFFKGDASLLKVAATSFKGDAIINTLHSASITGDASLLSIISSTATGDANLLSTVSETLTGDCTLITP